MMTAVELPKPRRGSVEQVLDVARVGVKFGGVTAIEDVSFGVGRGEIVAIVGPNGAGKTTLLNAICGIAPVHDGTVLHAGVDITRRGPTTVSRAGVGRSFQNPQLIEQKSVLDNVLCGLHCAMGYSLGHQVFRPNLVARREREAHERALALLDTLELVGTAETAVSALPYGSRKLVDIARAALTARSLLLLDEPTSGLDDHEQASLRQSLPALRGAAGVAIVLVEHHMDFVEAVADTVVCLRSGSVCIIGATAQVLNSAIFAGVLAGDVGTEHRTGLRG